MVVSTKIHVIWDVTPCSLTQCHNFLEDVSSTSLNQLTASPHLALPLSDSLSHYFFPLRMNLLRAKFSCSTSTVFLAVIGPLMNPSPGPSPPYINMSPQSANFFTTPYDTSHEMVCTLFLGYVTNDEPVPYFNIKSSGNSILNRIIVISLLPKHSGKRT
jgi:hypothetical protein